MSSLLVINGPPGVGKTVVGHLLAEAQPQTLRLDLDEVRALISGWETDKAAAGQHARALATEMVRVALARALPVVVTQLFARHAPIDALRAVADDEGAGYHEVVLTAPLDVARARFLARGGPQLETLVPPDNPTRTVDEAYADLHERVLAIAAERPHALVVDSIVDDPVATTVAVLRAIGAEPPAEL